MSPRAKIVINERSELSMRGTARVGRRTVAQLMWTRDGQLISRRLGAVRRDDARMLPRRSPQPMR
jgi:hypothetical protein